MGRAPKTFNPFRKTKASDGQVRARRIVRRRYDRQRGSGVRLWYGRVRWKRLRLRVLERDGWLCQSCMNVHERDTPATVVDHVTPHKGDEDLFYNINNLQGLCKPCHDRKTAGQDGGFGNARRS